MSHNTVARLCAGRALPSSATTTVTAAAHTLAAGAQIAKDGAGLAAGVGQGAVGDGSGLEPPCFLVLGVLGAAAAHRPPGPNPSPGPDGYQKVTPVLYPAIERQRTTPLTHVPISYLSIALSERVHGPGRGRLRRHPLGRAPPNPRYLARRWHRALHVLLRAPGPGPRARPHAVVRRPGFVRVVGAEGVSQCDELHVGGGGLRGGRHHVASWYACPFLRDISLPTPLLSPIPYFHPLPTTLYVVASLAAHGCVAPVPLCTLRLTVAALHNASYTLVAAPDEGWQHPTALVDGQPQAGAAALGAFR